MDRNEAYAALDSVKYTQGKLAERTQWPLWRHALFALAETVLVFGISLPLPGTLAGFGIAMLITIFTVRDDKQRYGLFVSGWQGGRTRIVLLILIAFVLAMAFVSFSARGEPIPAPTAVVASLATFAGCLIGSLMWQKIYRAELREGDPR